MNDTVRVVVQVVLKPYKGEPPHIDQARALVLLGVRNAISLQCLDGCVGAAGLDASVDVDATAIMLDDRQPDRPAADETPKPTEGVPMEQGQTRDDQHHADAATEQRRAEPDLPEDQAAGPGGDIPPRA